MATTTRRINVKADPTDDKHNTPLDVQVPVPERREQPERAQLYITATHPDLGIQAVFAPGDVLPDWYTPDPET